MSPSQPSFRFDLISAESRELLKRVSSQADSSGTLLYLAGGIVRDLLLGRPVKDIDLVVEGDAIRLAQSLARLHGGKVTVHPAFGTASWYLPAEMTARAKIQDSLDLATARTSGMSAQAHFRPSSPLRFGEPPPARLHDQCNGLAPGYRSPWSSARSVRGQVDLGRRLVQDTCILHHSSMIPRACSGPSVTPRRYAFEIAAETRELFNGEALEVLSSLSGERLRHELDLILDEPEAASMLEDASRLGLLTALHPSIHHCPPVLGSCCSLARRARTPPGGGSPQPRIRALVDRVLPGTVLAALRDRLALDAGLAKILFAASELLRDCLAGWEPSQPWTPRLDRVAACGRLCRLPAHREPALRTTWHWSTLQLPTRTGMRWCASG